MSLALARKYRPTSFEDLIGQEAVSSTLSLALQNDRLSHAYLFSGLRGSGKTSTARIFAKALLCEQGTTAHPCNNCSNCIMANEGRHIDIIEMDGASNRKIDDIRELIEHTKYKPAIGRYKIFIIDEVHMLTKEAFNALLKTLEEPPSFVKFILATTDPLKLPATILSRTQHFRFRKISQPILEKHLAHILNLEGVEYEKEAISIIARSGAGSVRDALTLLDQAIVYSKNFIDIATVTNMLGIIEPSLLENLIDSIISKDEKAILEFISISSDFEAEMIIDELSLYLKELLLSNSHKLTPMVIDRFFRVLADSKRLLSVGADGEFVLSLSLFKMMESLQIQDIDSMIHTLEQELSGIKVSPPTIATPTPKPTIKENITKETISKEEEPPPQIESPTPIIEEPKVEKPIDKGVKLFEKLIEKLYDRNYELGKCFEKSIEYNSFSNNLLTWESTATADDKTMLKNNWGIIRMFVQDIFGFETKIKNISKELPSNITCQKVQIDEPVSMIEDELLNSQEPITNSCVSPDDGSAESAKEKDEKTILQEPMVAKALELFAPKKVRLKRKS
ncbi:MAG: DNA polymerase III subunit gamma/tau [Epsilonproteobacteria bacterium]|nr:DNA polymerase III subunit gamma/tau [Campylobacterota bacterium]